MDYFEVPNSLAPPLLLVPNFGIEDVDSTKIELVVIELMVAYNLEQEFLTFNTTGTNISALRTSQATMTNFTHTYSLEGTSSLMNFIQVLYIIKIQFCFYFLVIVNFLAERCS